MTKTLINEVAAALIDEQFNDQIKAERLRETMTGNQIADVLMKPYKADMDRLPLHAFPRGRSVRFVIDGQFEMVHFDERAMIYSHAMYAVSLDLARDAEIINAVGIYQTARRRQNELTREKSVKIDRLRAVLEQFSTVEKAVQALPDMKPYFDRVLDKRPKNTLPALVYADFVKEFGLKPAEKAVSDAVSA